jgi:hypothetical protein
MDLKLQTPFNYTDSSKTSDHLSILNFMNQLRSLENSLLQMNQYHCASQPFFYAIIKAIQSVPVSRNQTLLNSSLLCLSLNMKKIATAQKTLAYIKEIRKSLGTTVQIPEEEDPTKRSSADTSANSPGQIAQKKIETPKIIPIVKHSTTKLPDLSRIGERKIGIPFFYLIFLGNLNLNMRIRKILKYKLKLYKRRDSVPVVRKFFGRSKIAQKKARLRGRFVKQTKKIFSVNNGKK